MAFEDHETENLFSYGTLRREEVQLATFGRRLKGHPDTLRGYALKTIQIRDENFAARNGAHQHNLNFTGKDSDGVEGMVFKLTKEELEQADSYEPAEYGRVLVNLRSGLTAWIYLSIQ